jgi:excisionase family DNA binding protein
VSSQPIEFHPADLLPIEEVAKRLHVEVTYIREKVRRRSPNAMPCYNLGRHLLFSWPDVCAWIRETGRGAPHMKHHRTRKMKNAA